MPTNWGKKKNLSDESHLLLDSKKGLSLSFCVKQPVNTLTLIPTQPMPPCSFHSVLNAVLGRKGGNLPLKIPMFMFEEWETNERYHFSIRVLRLVDFSREQTMFMLCIAE